MFISLIAPPLILLMRGTPLSWIYPLGRVLGRVGTLLLKRRKKIAMANLRLVFGQKKDEYALKKIYRDFLVRTVTSGLEIVKFALLPSAVLKEHITIVGKEHLDETLKAGKGVLAPSIHLGNFTLIGSRLTIEGYDFSYILKYPKNRSAIQLVERYREAVGIHLINGWNKRSAAQGSLQQLRQRGILCILLDQNAPYADVQVNFFGYPVPAFKGPVILATRTNASILPIFIVAGKGHRHTIIVEKPFRLITTDDKEKDVVSNLARLMKLTEGYIERYPEQWWWWHRRWKKHIDYKNL